MDQPVDRHRVLQQRATQATVLSIGPDEEIGKEPHPAPDDASGERNDGAFQDGHVHLTRGEHVVKMGQARWLRQEVEWRHGFDLAPVPHVRDGTQIFVRGPPDQVTASRLG